MIRLALIGSEGRMGREISALAQESQIFDTVVKVHRGSPLDLSMSGSGGSLDVAIDFSSPEIFGQVCETCARLKVPLVSGTTGLGAKEFAILDRVSAQIPVLWAPNMSLGIAILNEAVKVVAERAEHFDFQVEEFHHRNKKDRPGGTALWLHQNLMESVQKPVPDPVAIRGGGIFGVHKIWAMADEETLLFEHTALNRRVFARGALLAAKWIVKRSPARYQMADVLRREK